jgi:hypothetical protein
MASLGQYINTRYHNGKRLGEPTIAISLSDVQSSGIEHVTSYNSTETVNGSVSVSAKHDTSFDEVDISFVGEQI